MPVMAVRNLHSSAASHHVTLRDKGRGSAATVPAAAAVRQVPSSPHGKGGASGEQTEDRVHAWYRAHGVTAAQSAQPANAADTATTAHKATTEDFDRAAARQSQAMRQASAQEQRQTTDADDSAEAAGATHIPRTAPTARVPDPFLYPETPNPGDTPATPGSSAAGSHGAGSEPEASLPVNRSRNAKERVRPRADRSGDSASLVSERPGETPAVAPWPATRSAVTDAHTLAAELNRTPAPRLDLPAADAPTRKATPAIAAVKASARAPQIDATVIDGMVAENFDGTAAVNSRAAARLAVALAGDADPAAAPVKRMRAEPAAGDRLFGPATGSTGEDRTDAEGLFDVRGRTLMIAPMRGSHEVLVHQNQMALADGLDRIEDDGELGRMRRSRLLVALPNSAAIGPDARLPVNRRYARPWTVRFLQDLGRAHYARFGSPLIITSAARTVDFQRHLVRVNGNAAPPTGQVASPHLYGQAIDLGKHGMTVEEIAWMRAYLTPVMQGGKIDVEEEFQQSCFHISVYRRYLGNTAPQASPRLASPLLQAKAPIAPRHRHLPTALLAAHLP